MSGHQQTTTAYDPNTDVLYVGFGSSRYTDEEEVAPGIHVLYAYDGERKEDVVAIEIEYFKERFSNIGRVPPRPQVPFMVSTSALA